MVVTKYDFPLPNNGDKYDFTSDELVKLLNHVYECGYENARNAYDPSRQGKLTWASSNNSDDDNGWYTAQFVEGEH